MNEKNYKNVISKIEPDSIAEELGIEMDDILLSINGKEIMDILDYLFLISDDYLEVEIEKKMARFGYWKLIRIMMRT